MASLFLLLFPTLLCIGILILHEIHFLQHDMLFHFRLQLSKVFSIERTHLDLDQSFPSFVPLDRASILVLFMLSSPVDAVLCLILFFLLLFVCVHAFVFYF